MNPRSLESWCVKGTEDSALGEDYTIPLTHHDPRNHRLICFVKKNAKSVFGFFRIEESNLGIFLKKRALRFRKQLVSHDKIRHRCVFKCFKMDEINFIWFNTKVP